MKKSLLVAILGLFLLTAFSQAPLQLNYQAVVRDNTGQPVANNTAVALTFIIHSGTTGGASVYTETISTTANEFGLVNVQIGSTGNLSTVNWGASSLFLQVQASISGGTITDMGTTQLLSVPYALYAQTSGASNAWGLSGNAADSGNFIGTTNTTPLNFRVNNKTAGHIDTTARGITSFGYTALANITGSFSTAFGSGALQSNYGRDNTAFGYAALYVDTSGTDNTANGVVCLTANTSGSLNTAMGARSMFSNTTGSHNTAVGELAAFSNTGGLLNTAMGSHALNNNITGCENTACGDSALFINTDSFNTAYGAAALVATTTSQFNVAVGYHAGKLYNNGYNNVFVGANTDVNGANYFNVIAIGQGTVVTGSSVARFGNSATVSIGGQVDWSTISDGRYKNNIKEDVKGLDFIMKLRPVTYNLKATELSTKLNETRGRDLDGKMQMALAEKEKVIQSGFVAQEVEKAANEVGYDFSGVDKPKNDQDLYGLRYAEFVVPLVKAAQELSAKQDASDAKIQEMQKMIHTLQQQIQQLKGSAK